MFRSLLKNNIIYKSLKRSVFYCNIRGYFPVPKSQIIDDGDSYGSAIMPVIVNWPDITIKPIVGIIRDRGPVPRWTKYRRFLESNQIPYKYYDLDSTEWLDKAKEFDVIVGIDSSAPYYIEQIRRKYYILEKCQNKLCYPGFDDIMLFEDKILEHSLCKIYGLPFINTYVYYNREEAVHAASRFKYPLVSKIIPGSGAVGVELVKTEKQCRRIIDEAFSRRGRNTHTAYARQKNYVYFQEYVPNDGYDIRVIVIGQYVFGYYRRAPRGDFRASGSGFVEKRALPTSAIEIARRANDILKRPMLVVDFLKGLDDKYYIIELSPLCRIDTPEQLHVNGAPGVYVFSPDGSYRFEAGRYWVHELALREFLLTKYLANLQQRFGKQIS